MLNKINVKNVLNKYPTNIFSVIAVLEHKDLGGAQVF
jgi:hypothetical protein